MRLFFLLSTDYRASLLDGRCRSTPCQRFFCRHAPRSWPLGRSKLWDLVTFLFSFSLSLLLFLRPWHRISPPTPPLPTNWTLLFLRGMVPDNWYRVASMLLPDWHRVPPEVAGSRRKSLDPRARTSSCIADRECGHWRLPVAIWTPPPRRSMPRTCARSGIEWETLVFAPKPVHPSHDAPKPTPPTQPTVVFFTLPQQHNGFVSRPRNANGRTIGKNKPRLTRSLGTQFGLTANSAVLWWYWPEAHSYFVNPFAVFLVGGATVLDVLYGPLLWWVRSQETVLPDGRCVAGGVFAMEAEEQKVE
jgi:hypothetical protein